MHRAVAILLVAYSVLVAGPVEGHAQRVSAPDSGVRRLLVAPFVSADPQLGARVADAVRDRLTQRTRSGRYHVVPKDTIAETLHTAGYPADTALSAEESTELARKLLAQEVVHGDVVRLADGSLRVSARLRYIEGYEFWQPLVVLTVRRARDVAARIVDEQFAARAQLDGLRACDRASRGRGAPDTAIAAARRAIDAYPRSAPARVCLGWALHQRGAQAEAMRAADEVLALDSTHVGALELRYALQHSTGDRAAARSTARSMRRARNARGGDVGIPPNPDDVRDYVDSVLAVNPRDSSVLLLRWQLLGSDRQYAQYLEAGDAFARYYPSAIDSVWYWRMSAAADLLGDRKRALEYASRAVRRFPGSASFFDLQGRMLLKATPAADSVRKTQHVGAVDSLIENAYAERVIAFLGDATFDSASAWTRSALAAGVGRDEIGNRVLQSVTPLFRTAQRSRLRADWQSALAGARTVDSLVPSRQSALLVQAAALEIGKDALGRLDRSKSCAEVRLAEEMFRLVRSRVPTGDGTRGDERMLGAALEAEPRLASYRKRFCHSASRRPR